MDKEKLIAAMREAIIAKSGGISPIEAFAVTTCAEAAQSHYEPTISTLKENVRLLAIEAQDVLSEKDTTIKEQAEKIEKLTGLLEKSHGVVRVFVADFMGYTPNGSVIEELWQSYKEQHGI